MNPEEKFNQEVRWVLQQLKYLKISTGKKELVDFVIKIRPIVSLNEPPAEAQQRAVLKIAKAGAIKITNQEIEDDTYGKDVIFTIEFLPKFDKFYKKWAEIEKAEKSKPPRQDNLLFRKELKPEITTGDLSAYSDGTIRYKGKIINLRNQLKDLCRLFMRNPNRLLTIDDIRDEIVGADKRKATPKSTIAKYVSELRNSLEVHFKRDVIFNQKEEGWYFKL